MFTAKGLLKCRRCWRISHCLFINIQKNSVLNRSYANRNENLSSNFYFDKFNKIGTIAKLIFQKPMLIFTHLLTLGNVSTNAAQTLDARNFHDSIFKFDGSLQNETLHDVWCISLAVFTHLYKYNFSAGPLSI